MFGAPVRGLALAGLFARKDERWAELAQALGFAMEGHNTTRGVEQRTLRGTFEGRPARVRPFLKEYGSGDDAGYAQFTAVEVDLPGDPAFTLRITREGLMAKLAKAVGRQDLEVGDAAFDKAFRVEASDEGRARQVLGPTVREGLLGLEAFEALVLEHGTVRIERSGLVTDPARVRSDLGALLRLAQEAAGFAAVPGA